MRVVNYSHGNLNGHADACCCDCCSVNATMDPSAPTVQTLLPQPVLKTADVQTASVYDRSATLGDLATLIGVLSALFYIFRGR